jgi:hypothetical protein
MKRSAVRTSLVGAALLLLAACGPTRPATLAERAEADWQLYLDHPDDRTYENFIRSNRAAAREHGEPSDREGVELQLRALEAQAAEAVRASRVDLADQVSDRVDEIEKRDQSDVYDDALPGAKKRLAEAKAKVAPLIR